MQDVRRSVSPSAVLVAPARQAGSESRSDSTEGWHLLRQLRSEFKVLRGGLKYWHTKRCQAHQTIVNL